MINSASVPSAIATCYPDQVIILGGGRWARVIANVLDGLLPPPTSIMMCSPRGYAELLAWKRDKNTGRPLFLENRWPQELSPCTTAVIVANAAHDHVRGAYWALEHNASVLIEKPFGTSSIEILELTEKASSCNGLLAAAHVLLFNRYLQNFSDVLPPLNEILSIKVEWVDAKGEYRHGGPKHYDPSVPVYLDCLPHIISVLRVLYDERITFIGSNGVDQAGSKVAVELAIAGCSCSIVMQRNGMERVRRVVIESKQEIYSLDFTVEPGVIGIGGHKVCADLNWNHAPRALSLMLEAFFAAVGGGELDRRLTVDIALIATYIAEEYTPLYQSQVMTWLIEALGSKGDDELIWYALSELIGLDLKKSIEKKEKREFIGFLRDQLQLAQIDITSPQAIALDIRAKYINKFYG